MMARNKKNEKSVGLAELRREQERLLYLCDSIKLSVTKEEARVRNDDEEKDNCDDYDDYADLANYFCERDKMQVPLIKLITMIGTAFSRVVELMLSIQVNFLLCIFYAQHTGQLFTLYFLCSAYW